MRQIYVFLLTLSILSCNHQNEKTQLLQSRIDSLQQQVDDAYKPGFGEFMSGIQAHHSKLWFAGQNQNWKLADFEVHEIMEAVNGRSCREKKMAYGTTFSRPDWRN